MKLFFATLFCGLSSIAFAQSNYHQGYVLKNNGDTLKGYVNYREWENSPKKIQFKTVLNDKKSIELSAGEIKKFEVAGLDTYMSYIGPISMDKGRFPDLSIYIDTTVVIDTVFIKRIATGKNLTLYSYDDELKQRFFISEKRQQPIELKFHKYLKGEYEQQVINSDVYKGQLLLYINEYAADKNKLTKGLEDLQYEQGYLVSLINEINNNNNESVKKAGTTRFFVGAGVASTTINFSSFDNTGKITNISPKLSAGTDFFFNPSVQKFVIRLEVSLSYSNPQFSFYSYKQTSAQFTPQLLYNFYNGEKVKVYIDAGFSLILSSYSNGVYHGGIPNYNPVTFNGLWGDFPMQAGIVFNKRVELFASYVIENTYSGYMNARDISFGLKLRLGKR